MTKSQKSDIVSRVKWIHRNREKIRDLNGKIRELSGEVSSISNETVEVVKSLKRDMGDQTRMNIKIDGKYYTLDQNVTGVEIYPLIIDIEV